MKEENCWNEGRETENNYWFFVVRSHCCWAYITQDNERGWVRLWECKMSTHRARLLELLCSSSSLISKWVESLPIFFCLFFLFLFPSALFHTAAFLAHPDASVSDAAHCCLFYSYFGVVCFFHPHLASLCEDCGARCQEGGGYEGKRYVVSFVLLCYPPPSKKMRVVWAFIKPKACFSQRCCVVDFLSLLNFLPCTVHEVVPRTLGMKFKSHRRTVECATIYVE